MNEVTKLKEKLEKAGFKVKAQGGSTIDVTIKGTLYNISDCNNNGNKLCCDPDDGMSYLKEIKGYYKSADEAFADIQKAGK